MWENESLNRRQEERKRFMKNAGEREERVHVLREQRAEPGDASLLSLMWKLRAQKGRVLYLK
jgi:hypothetical protein